MNPLLAVCRAIDAANKHLAKVAKANRRMRTHEARLNAVACYYLMTDLDSCKGAIERSKADLTTPKS